ncbi:hypothetical protein, partial [Staphylococcus haemolyticus]|uniref:hypothetical protein n=1 Tax=Staphylococcus haemolyticus TaxID=1283 RepID=UPI003B806704
LRIPTLTKVLEVNTHFSHNVCEYFDKILTPEPVELVERVEKGKFIRRLFEDKTDFAKETLLWGRKSGTIMAKCEYE